MDKVICEKCGNEMKKVTVKLSECFGSLVEKRLIEMYHKCNKCGNKR